MIAVDCQMPIVVPQRRREDLTVGSSGFESFDSSVEKLLIVQERKFISDFDDTESSVRSEWLIVPKQNPDNILGKNSVFASAEPYLILENSSPFEGGNFFHKRTSVFPEIENEGQQEIEEVFLRGVQPTNHQYKILFTQEVELRTSALRRWRPTIVVDPILFEDDE